MIPALTGAGLTQEGSWDFIHAPFLEPQPDFQIQELWDKTAQGRLDSEQTDVDGDIYNAQPTAKAPNHFISWTILNPCLQGI